MGSVEMSPWWISEKSLNGSSSEYAGNSRDPSLWKDGNPGSD
jgi:hypothetical protein